MVSWTAQTGESSPVSAQRTAHSAQRKTEPRRHRDTKSEQEIPDSNAETQRRRESECCVAWYRFALCVLRFNAPLLLPVALPNEPRASTSGCKGSRKRQRAGVWFTPSPSGSGGRGNTCPYALYASPLLHLYAILLAHTMDHKRGTERLSEVLLIRLGIGF